MEDGHFDVLIVGTGLTESISAAALSKAGFRVAHVDSNSYYGANEASLSHEELVEWLQSRAEKSSQKFSSVSWVGNTLDQSRQYAISLRPSIIPSIGPIISSLISSGVSRYGGFRLLENVGIYHESQIVKSVPGTKEDVFKTKEISLLEKRHLMRFLMFAVGDFENDAQYIDAADKPFSEYLKSKYSLSNEITSAIVYALSFSQDQGETTKIALPRLRKYLRSAGRYGASPFLLGHYGGTGELAQGFCRAAAVNGAVYILGRNLKAVSNGNTPEPSSSSRSRYNIDLEDFPEKLTASVVVCSPSEDILRRLPSGIRPSVLSGPLEQAVTSVARCIAVADKPIRLPAPNSPTEQEDPEENVADYLKPLDAGIIVFPPSTVPGGSDVAVATLLVTGEGSMSTPAGKWILYISVPIDEATKTTKTAEDVLKPYLKAVMTLTLPSSPSTSDVSSSQTPEPLFSAYYFEHPDSASLPKGPLQADTDQDPSVRATESFIISPPLDPFTSAAEAPDVAAVNAEKVFWQVINVFKSTETGDVGDGSSVASSIEGFWPPIDPGEGSDGEDGW